MHQLNEAYPGLGLQSLSNDTVAIRIQAKKAAHLKPVIECFNLLAKDHQIDFALGLINNEINNNEICLFMKGTPDAPQCGFSMAVSNMLKILEVNFKGINVLENEQLRNGIKEFSEWPTIPQLYIKKEFVGGCDIIKEMYENGELKKILEEKKINFKK